MSKTERDPVVTGLSAEERLAIETFYRAFNEGRPELLDEAVTPDWQDIPLAPHQRPGREGMKPLLREFLTAFPDMKISVQEIIGAPGRAAVRAELSGTHQGEWMGIAPTHKAFRMALHEFHSLRDGQLTQTWHLEDWMGWLSQVGVAPGPRGG